MAEAEDKKEEPEETTEAPETTEGDIQEGEEKEKSESKVPDDAEKEATDENVQEKEVAPHDKEKVPEDVENVPEDTEKTHEESEKKGDDELPDEGKIEDEGEKVAPKPSEDEIEPEHKPSKDDLKQRSVSSSDQESEGSTDKVRSSISFQYDVLAAEYPGEIYLIPEEPQIRYVAPEYNEEYGEICETLSSEDHVSQDTEYLKRVLGTALTYALVDIANKRPVDPIHFLAHWLIKWRWNKVSKEKYDEEVKELIIEREEYRRLQRERERQEMLAREQEEEDLRRAEKVESSIPEEEDSDLGEGELTPCEL